jgi:hypothetical protein
LAVVFVAGWLLVGITLSHKKMGFVGEPSRGVSDIDLYRAEASRIAAGESYYDAAKSELEARGYPTQSIFNWRTPLPVWLVGVLSPAWAQAIVAAVAIGLLVVAGHVVAKESGLGRSLLTLLFLIGAVLSVALRGAYIMPEVWCGVLIAASLVCYGIERRGLAVLLGVAALFLRELAAPYCVVCALFALSQRRWSEVRDWALGAVAYATFYAWHLTQILPLIDPGARGHSEGWLQFGGAAFVISLVQMNVFLLLLPQWVSAIYLILALLGFTALESDWGRRAAWTACAFSLFFGVVGQPFNQYWGSVFAPLFALGAAHGVAATVDLLRAARLPTHATWSSKDATV